LPNLLPYYWNLFTMATSANDNDGLAEKKEAIKKLKKIPNIAAHHN